MRFSCSEVQAYSYYKHYEQYDTCYYEYAQHVAVGLQFGIAHFKFKLYISVAEFVNVKSYLKFLVNFGGFQLVVLFKLLVVGHCGIKE